MLHIASALILTAFSAPGDCRGMPVAISEGLEAAIAARPGTSDQASGLHVTLVDETTLLVRLFGEEAEAPPLRLNGSDVRYAWSETIEAPAILLQGCALSGAALGLASGPHFVEWAGPEFFKARPQDLLEGGDGARTISFSSRALGGARDVYIHRPAGWDGAAGDPLVLTGDGLAGSDFARISQTLAADGRIRPIAIASARFGEGWLSEAGVDQRSAEYLTPDADAGPQRQSAYEAHETFFFEEFFPFAVSELGGEVGPVFLFGISASASFALEQGLQRPDRIEAVIAASPPITDETRSLVERYRGDMAIHLWCGDLESLFCAPLSEMAQAADFQLHTRRASHTTPLWEEALAASLIELAPPSE